MGPYRRALLAHQMADVGDLDGRYGQIARPGNQTMGFFLSIDGWSAHVLPTIKQNSSKSITFMEGDDLRSVPDARFAATA